MLSPALLRARASNVPGSREMLALSAAALYARRVIVENNRDLRRVMARDPRRGASCAGRGCSRAPRAGSRARPSTPGRRSPAACARAAARAFRPGLRDAPLLGGTVIDLLAREEGEPAAAAFATRLDPQGPRAALAKAFGGRPLRHTEEAWRSHLSRGWPCAGAP